MPGERILIVDDDRTTGKVIEIQLSNLGYSVIGFARSGNEAIKQVEESTPDLVLMDINLGRGMDGIDAADVILREHRTPVIYVTAYADEATLERAKRTSPYGYINKPIRPTDLRTTISLALDRARRGAAEANKGKSKPWKIEVQYSAEGELSPVNEETLAALKDRGWDSAEELLPAAHADLLATCTQYQKPQFATGRHRGRMFSWEYRPVGPDCAGLTITDVTENAYLIDQNVRQASLSEALDRLATGVIFINENLKVFYTNKSADALLKSSRPLALKDGYLSCTSVEKTAELQRLVLQETGNTFTLEREGEPPLHLLVSPLHSHNENYGHDLPIAIIHIFETVQDSERIEDVIRSLYNLSPTEARIAAKLVLKPDLQDIANNMGITYNTARTHLKRIYSKTKTNRLSTLVHMIVTGPVGLLLHSTE